MSAVCPSCGEPGKVVGAVTLRALLVPAALAEAADAEGYLHCRTLGCDVVYFHPARHHVIHGSGVRVRVGMKDTEGPRPVCYCFGHSFASIEGELRATGSTDVVEAITARCRAGEDRCEETNPQGSCCLGNVRRVVKELREQLGAAGEQEGPEAMSPVDHGCCATSEEARTPAVDSNPDAAGAGPGTRFAAGAVVAAALSSTCCWLPLLLLGVGAGTSTVAVFFEAYRGWFLAGAVALLGGGFYASYRREASCAPGSACEVPRPRALRAERAILGVAALMTAAFAFFPSYASVLSKLDPVGPSTVAGESRSSTTERVVRVFEVDGMTCEGCVGTLERVLVKQPGVAFAKVSFEDRAATVGFESGHLDEEGVLAAIKSAGYTGKRRE